MEVERETTINQDTSGVGRDVCLCWCLCVKDEKFKDLRKPDVVASADGHSPTCRAYRQMVP